MVYYKSNNHQTKWLIWQSKLRGKIDCIRIDKNLFNKFETKFESKGEKGESYNITYFSFYFHTACDP